MPEISSDELKRLARDFLVGRGGEAELEDIKRAMDSDPRLAMELLQQMQSALEDAAPAGFSPDQWKEVDGRVNALIQPLAKSGMGLGSLGRIFSRIFGRKGAAARAPEASGRIKRRGARADPESKAPSSLISPEAVVAPPGAEAAEGMEEMAPIAPAVTAPSPALAPPEVVPETPKAAVPKPKSGSGGTALVAILVGLLCFCGALWGGWKLALLWRARKKPLTVALPTPLPTAAPTPYSGPPRRLEPPASQTEPLPSELPPMTPQAAGKVEPVPGLGARDSEGLLGLPLP